MTTNSSINLNNTNASSTTYLRGDLTWVGIGGVSDTARLYANSLSLSTGVSTVIASVTLGVGTYLLSGNIFCYWGGYATAKASIQGWIGNTTAPDSSYQLYNSAVDVEFFGEVVPSNYGVVSSGTTTFSLVAGAIFSTSVFEVCGNIIAVKIA